MTGSARSSQGLDIRRRRVLFRAWHRGIREMDLILGSFADDCIEQLSDTELSEFERLMDLPDQQVLDWITGSADVPPSHDGPLLHRLRAVQARRG